MIIKILGGGCPKCERLEALARDVAGELGIEANSSRSRPCQRSWLMM